MRVVADSHAILWYVQGSTRLSNAAKSSLDDAEASDGIVVSVATIVDLWYVTQTTAGVSAEDLARLTKRLTAAAPVDLHAIDLAVVQTATSIPRAVLTDPWDRFIVATASALEVPLVTRDGAIQQAQLVETIW